MMAQTLPTAATIMSLAVASLASAQSASLSDPAHVRRIHDYAACIAEQREDDVRSVLAMDFRTDDYRDALNRVSRAHARCSRLVDGNYSTASVIMAGSFAETLLRKDGALSELDERTAHDPQRPALEARNAAEYMALCIVRTDPDGAEGLLSSPAASSQELDQLRSMSETLSGCAPAGSETRMTREALRSLVALAAYRLHTQKIGTAN
jgi:hypothetical protein